VLNNAWQQIKNQRTSYANNNRTSARPGFRENSPVPGDFARFISDYIYSSRFTANRAKRARFCSTISYVKPIARGEYLLRVVSKSGDSIPFRGKFARRQRTEQT